jgi:hypothetical protein
MARPRFADEVNVQIWRVAANVLQLRTASGLGEGLTSPHSKKKSLLRNVTRCSEAVSCELGNEASGSVTGGGFLD